MWSNVRLIFTEVVRSILWPILFKVELDAVSCRTGTDLSVARIGIMWVFMVINMIKK